MQADDPLHREVAAPRDLPHAFLAGGDQRVDLAALRTLNIEDLRSRWSASYGIEPLPRLSRELLIRGIAYRLQERARGGLSKKVLRRLEQISSGQGTSRVGGGSSPSMRLGTRLVREWQGMAQEVIVLQDGFLWNGGIYQSLSQIARLITGTRWSGPRFFGLNQEQVKRAGSHSDG